MRKVILLFVDMFSSLCHSNLNDMIDLFDTDHWWTVDTDKFLFRNHSSDRYKSNRIRIFLRYFLKVDKLSYCQDHTKMQYHILDYDVYNQNICDLEVLVSDIFRCYHSSMDTRYHLNMSRMFEMNLLTK
jgi:hypothetical protein